MFDSSSFAVLLRRPPNAVRAVTLMPSAFAFVRKRISLSFTRLRACIAALCACAALAARRFLYARWAFAYEASRFFTASFRRRRSSEIFMYTVELDYIFLEQHDVDTSRLSSMRNPASYI